MSRANSMDLQTSESELDVNIPPIEDVELGTAWSILDDISSIRSEKSSIKSSYSSWPFKITGSAIEVDADNIKRCNREITKKIPKAEIEKLVEERNSLVAKKFEDLLSGKEERRLKYVRWQLDRIDDALYGDKLDVLDQVSRQYQTFSEDLNKVLNSFVPRNRRR